MATVSTKVVAVIGASSNRSKFGNRAVRAFRRQGYTVVPINPHEAEIEGLKAYASVLDVPGPIDMATLYVPPDVGERVIESLQLPVNIGGRDHFHHLRSALVQADDLEPFLAGKAKSLSALTVLVLQGQHTHADQI